MFDIAMPITDINAKHNRNDVGIAKPTSNADLIPKDANTTIITSAIAVRTELSSCPTMSMRLLRLKLLTHYLF